MANKREINKARRNYSQQWMIDGNFFYQYGFYKWMLDFIKDRKVILEVGCGNGHSTLEIAKSGKRVIVIEENRYCMDNAKKLLNEHNISTNIIYREKMKVDNNIYLKEYSNITIQRTDDYQVLIIQGDILNDTTFFNWASKIVKVDAVICWLMGVHQQINKNKTVVDLGINSNRDYCWNIDEILLQHALKLLNESGVVQIVDRVGDIVTEDVKRAFGTLIENLPYKLNTVDYCRVERLETGMQMTQARVNGDERLINRIEDLNLLTVIFELEKQNEI